MKNRRIGIFAGLILAALFCLSLLPASAMADTTEKLYVTLPVSAEGTDCTAQLWMGDEDDKVIIDTKPIKAGETVDFVFLCEGVDKHSFTINLIDTDTDVITYDKTKYKLSVWIYYDDTYTLRYAFVSDPIGPVDTNGKQLKIEFTNVRTPKPCIGDPPVEKKIAGKPSKASPFKFTMTAEDPAFPMPNGIMGTQAEVTIVGEGKAEFGEISFTTPGIYTYKIVEVDGRIPGYIYDKSEYQVRYTVTDDGSDTLQCSTAFLLNGTEVPSMTTALFTNAFKSSPSPRTSDENNIGLWIGIFATAFLCIILLLLFYRRKNRK